MKPQPVKQKPIIKAQIRNFFSMFNEGDKFRSDEMVRYVKRYAGIKSMYSDTAIRYLREMRQDGELSYTCTNKEHRIFEIIAPGQRHSL